MVIGVFTMPARWLVVKVYASTANLYKRVSRISIDSVPDHLDAEPLGMHLLANEYVILSSGEYGRL